MVFPNAGKAQANEQRYSKLKEKYSELVQNHADLLRKNAEVTKQVSVARQAQVDLEREKKELADSFARVSDQAQRKVSKGGMWAESTGRGLLSVLLLHLYIVCMHKCVYTCTCL